MKMFLPFLLLLVVKNSQQITQYEPKWDSLDTRPLPEWYNNVKIGIFVHWGVFSVPSFGSEWFWEHLSKKDTEYVEFLKKTKPEGFTYQEFARDFTAEFFDPNDWADLFEKSGARYVVLTSKHHEGFTLWPSKYSFSWNAQDLGPHRDLVGDLAKAVRSKGLHFGLYHSLYEWFNPLYISDRNSNFTSQDFVRFKTMPELYEIVNRYEPEVIWSDGDWEADDTYWQSKEFLTWLYNESPVKDTVVVNDRWGKGVPCKHGDFFNCADRYDPGVLQKHKWENAMTIDRKSWGFRRNAKLSDYLKMDELIETLIKTVSCGGNVLINVGPTKDGIISPIFQERLLDLGSWLEINGEAIYQSTPWTIQNDTLGNVWYTAKDDSVYALSLMWPEDGLLKLGSATKLFGNDTIVKLLGFPGKLKWRTTNNMAIINLPCKSKVKSNWAWTLKISLQLNVN